MDKKHMDDPVNFSLGIGGPLYQFFLKIRLVKKPLNLYKRRISVICLFAWLPLLILTLFDGVAFSNVKIPFIYDIDVHVRFLLSLALLIYAEVLAHERLQLLVQQFLKNNIVLLAEKKKFYSIIVSTMRLVNSRIVEIFLILFVFTAGQWISRKSIPFETSIWYAQQINSIPHLSRAGYWYAFVSIPLFQFLLLRWYYRMGLWYSFLWRVSRLPLRLNSLHPDEAGGIGFLKNSILTFSPFLLAHSVLLTGIIFNRIWNADALLSQFQGEIISIMVFLVLLPLAPLLFFMPALVKAKLYGTLAYDVIATQYVNNFREKWIERDTKNNDGLLGTSDIQSLSDLNNSFDVSSQMRVLPFDRGSILSIIVITALPLSLLIFTIMPLDKILTQILHTML